MCRVPKSHYLHATADLEIMRGTAILNLRGCLTIDSLEILHQTAQEALGASQHILVDLSQAEFIDSSAIGELLELGNQVHLAGGELSLASISTQIYQILTILKLEKLFPIYPNRGAYFAKSPSKTSYTPPAAGGWIPNNSNTRKWSILKCCRIIDASTAQDLIKAGSCSLAVNPYLICDLSDTVILASAGLAAMAQLHQMALELQGEFRLVNCSQDTLRVIKMARFDRLLPLYSDFSLTVS